MDNKKSIEEVKRNEIFQYLEENGLLSYHHEGDRHVTSLIPQWASVPFEKQVFVVYRGRLIECRIKVVSIMPGYYMSKDVREPFLRHYPKDVVCEDYQEAFRRARSLFVAEAANLDGSKYIHLMPIDTMLFKSIESYKEFLMDRHVRNCCYVPDYEFVQKETLYYINGMKMKKCLCSPDFAYLDEEAYHIHIPQLEMGYYRTREECIKANFDRIPVLRFGQDNTKGK